MKKGFLYVISGPSGVGKNTVLNGFLERNPNFKLSVSTTTRAPRVGEVHSINYFFVTKNEFKTLIKEEKFLEFAEFNGNFYGTQKEYVFEKLEKGQNVILEIDTKGALQVKEKFNECILIFIMPPSVKDLETRLKKRNTEDEATIKSRLSVAFEEIENSKLFDYRIVNDDVIHAVTQLEEIMK